MENKNAKCSPTSSSSSSNKSQAQPLLNGVTKTLRQDKPQGFEAAKMCRKGLHQCHWGCGKFFESIHKAEDHPCAKRIQVFEELIDMNLQANQLPPQRYFDETAGILFHTGNGTEVNHAEQKGPLLREIKAALRRPEDKAAVIARWIQQHPDHTPVNSESEEMTHSLDF